MIDLLLHLDVHLAALMQLYGVWIYLIVFVVIFCETGLVITPFLPGDSLLFILGTLAAIDSLDLHLILAISTVAAILGDSVNYQIGKMVGPKIFHSPHAKILNKKYLVMTQEFYERHGPKTIVMARFMPIVRTFAPFVAGIGSMRYREFLLWNIVGAIAWVFFFIIAGYFFGNIPFVKEHLSLFILGIIFISVLPAVFEYLRNRRKNHTIQPKNH